MADISKIKIMGTEYDIKDEELRDAIAILLGQKVPETSKDEG